MAITALFSSPIQGDLNPTFNYCITQSYPDKQKRWDLIHSCHCVDRQAPNPQGSPTNWRSREEFMLQLKCKLKYRSRISSPSWGLSLL